MKAALSTAIVGLVMVATVTTAPPGSPVTAAGSDVGNVDFAAPLPDLYDHSTGGGFYGDGKNSFVKSELQGSDFACGDRVSFLAAFSTADTPEAAAPFGVEMTMRFTTDTTGQSGAALFPIVDSPMINVGDPALVPTTPTAYLNGSATVTASGDPYTNGAYEEITFEVAGLFASQTLVVRVDARIGCPYLPLGDAPTGNLQATLESVIVLGPPNEPADVGTGRQTINLKQVQKFINIGEPVLLVTKSAVVHGQACPGVAQLTVPVGVAVDYCFEVENVGYGPAVDLVLIDDMATPDDAADDIALDLVGLSDEDDDQSADDLGDGSVTAVLSDTTYGTIGTFTNTAAATSGSLIAESTASVTTEDVLAITKSRTGSGTPTTDQTISYEIVATNTSTVLTLDEVTITDANAVVGTCAPEMPATLGPGETMTCSASHVVTPADVTAGSVLNVASLTADFQGHPLGADSNEVIVPVAAPPGPNDPDPAADLDLRKSWVGSGVAELGDTITYQIVATNSSDGATLEGVTIDDANATVGTCQPAMPATLPPGASMTCTATRVVVLADTVAGSIRNIASSSGTFDGQPISTESNEVVVPVATAPEPELSLIKERVGSDPVAVGDVITYRITATNLSDRLTLDDIVIVDSNATIVSCTAAMPATLEPGASLTCTAERVVTASDAAAGGITNVASVDGYSADTDVTLAEVASNPVVVTVPAPIDLPTTGSSGRIAGTATATVVLGIALSLVSRPRRRLEHA